MLWNTVTVKKWPLPFPVQERADRQELTFFMELDMIQKSSLLACVKATVPPNSLFVSLIKEELNCLSRTKRLLTELASIYPGFQPHRLPDAGAPQTL